MTDTGSSSDRYPPHDFLGIPLSTPTIAQFIDELILLSGDRSRSHLISYINAHCANLFHKLPEYSTQ